MSGVLESVKVEGLYGHKTIEAVIADNTLILVGENGSGKTTFMRILFYTLSGQWLQLLQFKFKSVTLKIDGDVFHIERTLISKNFERHRPEVLRALPPSIRRKIHDLLEVGDFSGLNDALERFEGVRGSLFGQFSLFDEQGLLSERKFMAEANEYLKKLNSKIVYLPTYRRIERELASIYKGIDAEEVRRSTRGASTADPSKNSYIELVEFGMKDVDDAISQTLNKLKEYVRENLNKLTLQYLGDVVNGAYRNNSDFAEISEDTINSVLMRTPESILSADSKGRIVSVLKSSNSGDQDAALQKSIISHYFFKLYEFNNLLTKREAAISKFCHLCSEYMSDKAVKYDNINFRFSVVPKDASDDQAEIQLSELSSGEKQIVSLFSHLYLSEGGRHFVLIDEPELSLSVPWQMRFLKDIRNGEFCSGLVAVTHSPFVYDNELKKYAHAFGEFVSMHSDGNRE